MPKTCAPHPCLPDPTAEDRRRRGILRADEASPAGSFGRPDRKDVSTETDNTIRSAFRTRGVGAFVAVLGGLPRPPSTTTPRNPSVPAVAFAWLAALGFALPAASREALVVDHTYDLSQVPETILETVRANSPIVHYAHRSDGSAVPFGLEALAETDPARYPFHSAAMAIPAARRGIRFWDGMRAESYVTPDLYWNARAGRVDLDSILRRNPSIRYTAWTFCNEDDYWTWSEDPARNDYIRIMDSLEKAFPGVTFIYMTSAMRPAGGDGANIGQALYNEGLRRWARTHGKVLFDFADLDVWHRGRQHLELMRHETGGARGTIDTLIPIQHPAWREGFGPSSNGHHANDSMGVDKGRAWWYLMARLEGGWNPVTGLAPRAATPTASYSVATSGEGWTIRGPAIESRAVLLDVGGRELSRQRFSGELFLPARPAPSAGLVLRIVPGDGGAASVLRLPPTGL